MVRTCYVTLVTISAGLESARELGEFQAVWSNGVTIGSDTACDVVLPGLPLVAARVLAMSNHKLLYHLPPDTKLGSLQPVGGPAPRYDDRVDDSPFKLGDHVLQFGEVYREATP